MRIQQIEQGCVYQDSVGQFREVVAISPNGLLQFRRGKTGRSQHMFNCTLAEMADWAVRDVTEKQAAA